KSVVRAPHEVLRNGEGAFSLDRLDRGTRGHPAQKRELYGLSGFLRRRDLDGAAQGPFSSDQALTFEVAEMLMHGGKGRKTEVRADLFQGRCIAVSSNIVFEVVPHLFLSAGKNHNGLLPLLCQRRESESRVGPRLSRNSLTPLTLPQWHSLEVLCGRS